jgi:rhamnulokinase
MWIVQSLRKELCPDTSYGDIAELAKTSDFAEIFDVNDASFMAPDSMKGAIDAYLERNGKKLPKTDADYFNSAYHSLAFGYKVAISALEANTSKTYPEIYIVGGGAKNTYLNSLTEKYTSKKVRALPIEATAIGNLKIQLLRK